MAHVDRRPRIKGITPSEWLELRRIAHRGMGLYANLEKEQRRADLYSVFASIRGWMVDGGWSLDEAIFRLDNDFNYLEDM